MDTNSVNVKSFYGANGIKVSEQWTLDGKLHRKDGPAITTFYQNGNVMSESWFENGKYVNSKLPSEIYYERENNRRKTKECWLVTTDTPGQNFHRIDGPAVIEYHENGNKKHEAWYNFGKLHRENDLQAETWYYENGTISDERWFLNGHYHRDIESNGELIKPSTITYYENGAVNFQSFHTSKGKNPRDGVLPGWISYYKNGNKKEESWVKNNEESESESGCAYSEAFREDKNLPYMIEYFENHNEHIKHESWKRDDSSLPSNIYYYTNESFVRGPIARQIWMDNNLHNEYEKNVFYDEKGVKTKESLMDGGWFTETFYKNKIRTKETIVKYSDNFTFVSNSEKYKPVLHPNLTLYYRNGNKKKEVWYENDYASPEEEGVIHRLNEPAVIRYESNGLVKEQIWYASGVPFRFERNVSGVMITFKSDLK